jgi:Tol biopolymer transport system component
MLLAYVHGRSLLVARADGTKRRRIARAPMETYGPEWSPDGTRIVYSADGPTGSLELFVVTLANGRVTRLTNEEGAQIDPAWSPDGRHIAYVHTPPSGDLGALAVMQANGGRRRTLLGEALYRHPAWSPDGRRLAIVRGFEERAEIHTVSRDGDNLRRVTRNRFADREPDWRPPPR